MLQIAIVVFREIFEIALIIGILTAATKSIKGRAKWIVSGLAGGIIGAIILTLFTDKISESFNGSGQEVFNGAVLLSATAMIGWTVLWMQKHAKTISGELRNLGKAVEDGDKPIYSLLLVVFLSVLREGAEIGLFSYSYYVSGTTLGEISAGLTVGILLGTAFGMALYFGVLKIFGRYFFPITTWILIFLSAGIGAQAMGFWTDAGLVAAMGNPIFDSSAIISQHSYFGKFLNIFFGYIDHPYGSQLVAYVLIILTLSVGLKIAKSSK